MSTSARERLEQLAQRLLAVSSGHVVAASTAEAWTAGAVATIELELDAGANVTLAAFPSWEEANDAVDHFRSDRRGGGSYCASATNGAIALAGWAPGDGGDAEDAPGSWALDDVASAFAGKE